MNLAGLLLFTALFPGTAGLAWSQTAPLDSVNAPAQADQSVRPAVAPPAQTPDPLFDLPRLKPGGSSLIGGALQSVDRLRGLVVLRPFGRGKLTIAFDPRTQFTRGAEVASARDMHPGDRVYVETVLNGTAVFAKTIHLPTEAASGTAQGQIIGYDAGQERVSIRDQLSSRPIQFRLNAKTIITGVGVAPGALVQISFLPGKEPASVREILVLAAPGSVYTFSGRITFLDLSSHELVLVNTNDDNKYEVRFSPAALSGDTRKHLQEGASVTIAARFTGQRYVAESVTLLPDSTE